MRILLVNKFGPPSDAPTARVVAQLAEALTAAGHTCEIVASRGTYRGSQRGVVRALNEVAALARMFVRLLFSPRADRWIVLSSPPGLLIPAALVAAVRGMPIAHWVMDLYPDTAVAFGLLREDGPAHRLIKHTMDWALSRCERVFVLDADMQERLGGKAEVLGLWPLETTPEDAPMTVEPEQTWVYSGNLGRAHEWETLLAAQKLLEANGSRATLVFQSRGGELARVKERVKELELTRVEWRELEPTATFFRSLQGAGVLIVTQREEAWGCVWPSKLAVAMRIPRPLLWVGPRRSRIGEWLRRRPGTGVFNPGDKRALADWVDEWCGKPLPAEALAAWLAELPITSPEQAVLRLME